MIIRLDNKWSLFCVLSRSLQNDVAQLLFVFLRISFLASSWLDGWFYWIEDGKLQPTFPVIFRQFLTWKAKDVEWKRRGTHYSHQYDSITSLKSLHFHFIVYSFYPSFPEANHLFSFQVSFEKSLVWYVGLIALLSPTRNLPTWPHTLKNEKDPYYNAYKHSWAFKAV